MHFRYLNLHWISQSKRNVTINFCPDFISACHSPTFFLSVIFRVRLNLFLVCLKGNVVTLSTQYTEILGVHLIVRKCALQFSAEMRIFTRRFVLDSSMLSTYYVINYYSSNLLALVQNNLKKLEQALHNNLASPWIQKAETDSLKE